MNVASCAFSLERVTLPEPSYAHRLVPRANDAARGIASKLAAFAAEHGAKART